MDNKKSTFFLGLVSDGGVPHTHLRALIRYLDWKTYVHASVYYRDVENLKKYIQDLETISKIPALASGRYYAIDRQALENAPTTY
jgi:bisphosphoglycerate-independent phosphoglycerate mutase (AlkP superfamily)